MVSLDQKYINLLLSKFTGSGHLGISLNASHILNYSKLKGANSKILLIEYHKLEGLNWASFDEIDDSEKLDQEISFQLKQINNYLSTINNTHRSDSTFSISKNDLENNDFFNAYYSMNFIPIEDTPIEFELYQERVVQSFTKSISNLIQPIIRHDLLHSAKLRRFVDDAVYFRTVWNRSISKLYNFVSNKLNTDKVKPIQTYIETNYFVERYQNNSLKEYKDNLNQALRTAKSRKLNN